MSDANVIHAEDKFKPANEDVDKRNKKVDEILSELRDRLIDEGRVAWISDAVDISPWKALKRAIYTWELEGGPSID